MEGSKTKTTYYEPLQCSPLRKCKEKKEKDKMGKEMQ